MGGDGEVVIADLTCDVGCLLVFSSSGCSLGRIEKFFLNKN